MNIIQHPGLVGVFESGRLEDGAAYIVMEYLEGELLSTRLQKAVRLPLRTALTLGRQIASALAAAHGKRIVHRVLSLRSLGVAAARAGGGAEKAAELVADYRPEVAGRSSRGPKRAT